MGETLTLLPCFLPYRLDLHPTLLFMHRLTALPIKPQPGACRMPEDWDPGDAGRAWARSELTNPRVTDEWIESETDRCKDWAFSTAGQKAVKCNWNRFWKNWMRTAHGRLREQEARERWREQRGRPAH